VPSITNAIFVDTVQALTDRLWEAGYQVLLGLSGYPATREEALLSAILSRRPDAIYLTGINHARADRTPVEHQLNGVDDMRIRGTLLAQGKDGMLDSDEIAVAKVAGGAVTAGTLVVV